VLQENRKGAFDGEGELEQYKVIIAAASE